MAAYWRILLPYKITYSDNPEMDAAFQETFGAQDYEFAGVSEYEVQSPPLPSGNRLTFQRKEKTYMLSEELLRTEWKPLCGWIWTTFREMYGNVPKRKFHASIFDDRLFLPFLESFTSVDFSGMNDAYQENVDAIEENYFLRFDDIPSQVVYEGWPLPTGHGSSMETTTFLYGYEKMNMLAAETVAFNNFANQIQEQGENLFRLSRYVLALGF